MSRDDRSDDDMGDNMDIAGPRATTSSEVQATTQMASSGAQAKPETRSSGAQAKPETRSSGTMATEGRSEEIARLEAIHEQEQQALIATRQANIETITKQVREQIVGEAERRHEQKIGRATGRERVYA